MWSRQFNKTMARLDEQGWMYAYEFWSDWWYGCSLDIHFTRLEIPQPVVPIQYGWMNCTCFFLSPHKYWWRISFCACYITICLANIHSPKLLENKDLRKLLWSTVQSTSSICLPEKFNMENPWKSTICRLFPTGFIVGSHIIFLIYWKLLKQQHIYFHIMESQNL